MEDDKMRLTRVVELCRNYCVAVENAGAGERMDFLAEMVNYLPRIYWEFADLDATKDAASVTLNPEEEDSGYFATYVDETQYEAIRSRLSAVMGEDDTFLETYEEDMKYSDTPIAATISESLADVYQNLYNFVSSVKDGGAEMMLPSFRACKDDFVAYWGQTLCNVLRAIHPLRFG